eukprot:SAG22_NODE_1102_length_5560_cov_44.363120_3_plen_114_part_00
MFAPPKARPIGKVVIVYRRDNLHRINAGLHVLHIHGVLQLILVSLTEAVSFSPRHRQPQQIAQLGGTLGVPTAIIAGGGTTRSTARMLIMLALSTNLMTEVSVALVAALCAWI